MTLKEFQKRKEACEIGIEGEKIVIADAFTLELKAYLTRGKEYKVGDKDIKKRLEGMMSAPSSEK